MVPHAICRHSLLDYDGCKYWRDDLLTFDHSNARQWLTSSADQGEYLEELATTTFRGY